MRRCGNDVLHDPHPWHDERTDDDQVCDGRTRNESMVGQLTATELRDALDDAQPGALVAFEGRPLELDPDNTPHHPVFKLRAWRPRETVADLLRGNLDMVDKLASLPPELLTPDPNLMASPEGDTKGLRELQDAAQAVNVDVDG